MEIYELTRNEFREAVFARDGNKCRFCDNPAKDAHHIMERRLFTSPDEMGGYSLNNGISVCAEHHLECEKTNITVEDCLDAIGLKFNNRLTPSHLYPDQPYDKWGNPIMSDGTRIKGELFYDESVQKILTEHLSEFREWYKYPRTYHLPFSASVTSDDKYLQNCSQFEGNQVILTTKLDGENCFPANTKISMSDGSYKFINKVKVGDMVKSVNDRGKIESRKVSNVFNNGRNVNKWLKLKFKKSENNIPKIVYTTDNHEFFINNNQVKKASELKIKDTVISMNSEYNLTRIQRQVILGKLLGDGSLHIKHNKAHIQFSHKLNHEKYVDWTNQYLGSLTKSKKCIHISGYGSKMIKSWSMAKKSIYDEFSKVIKDGRKSLHPEIINIIDVIAIAIWYMDDGNLIYNDFQKDRCQFSTCHFNTEECEILQKCLLKFGITSSMKFYKYNYLVLNWENTEKLHKLISPYICDVMRYKLIKKERYKTPIQYNDNEDVRENLNKCILISKEYRDHPNNYIIKHDIEVEKNHNYFANDILVHNCSIYSDYLHARSVDGRHHWTRDWLKNYASSFQHDIPEGMRICGENLYAKHSIEYNELESFFYGFSMWNNEDCLSWSETSTYFKLLNIIPVPVLYEGVFDESKISEICNSLNWGKCEGAVLRNAESFKYRDFKKNVAKFVRPNHVQTIKHWMHGNNQETNKLKETK